MKLEILISVLVLLVPGAGSACTFPSDLRGEWNSSDNGAITFSSSSLNGMDVTLGGFSFPDWDCFDKSGDKYLLRSQSTTFGSSGSIVDTFHYRCLELHHVSSYIFYYYQLAPFQTGVNQYMESLIGGSIANVCVRDTTSMEVMHNVMVKSDQIATAAISCPSMIIGTFNHSVDGAACTSMESCTDEEITFNNTGCTDISYSSTGTVKCLVSISRFNQQYLTLLNTDSTVDMSTTYRFVCLAMTQSGQDVTATVSPTDCQANQTASDGGSASASFIKLGSCPTAPTEDDDNVVAIVVPIVVIAVLAAAAAVGIWYYLKRKNSVVANKGGMSDIENHEKAKKIQQENKVEEKETKLDREQSEVERPSTSGSKPDGGTEKPTPQIPDVLTSNEPLAPNNRLTPIHQVDTGEPCGKLGGHGLPGGPSPPNLPQSPPVSTSLKEEA